jgi:hypothetical protein
MIIPEMRPYAKSSMLPCVGIIVRARPIGTFAFLITALISDSNSFLSSIVNTNLTTSSSMHLSFSLFYLPFLV